MSGAVPECRVADDVAGSLIARLDPRIRLLAALAFIAGVIAVRGPAVLATALVAALLLVALARLPARTVAHRMMHVEGFMLVLLLVLPFTVPGESLVAFGPVTVTGDGLLRAFTIALRVNAAVLATFALLGSLEPVRLGRAAAQLGAPLSLVHLFLFAVRFVGVFGAEASRLLEAMRARGFIAGSNRHTWRTFGNLAGMLLLRSLERAERVEEAMRCRGYSGRLPSMAANALTRIDGFFAATLTATVAAMIVADRLA